MGDQPDNPAGVEGSFLVEGSIGDLYWRGFPLVLLDKWISLGVRRKVVLHVTTGCVLHHATIGSMGKFVSLNAVLFFDFFLPPQPKYRE